MTAPEALDFADISKILRDLSGRPVVRRTISDDEAQTTLVARGLPKAVIAITLGFYRAARDGEFEATDPTLAGLIGRKVTTMRNILSR